MRNKKQTGNFKLKVKKSRAGLGLFAEELIPRDSYIIEYVGREISKEEEYTSKSKYLFEVSSKKTIDGQARSNTARYINHSCRPNAKIKIEKGRVFILAKRHIKPGEEINYDYGKEYWRDRIEPKGCLCDKCLEARSKPLAK